MVSEDLSYYPMSGNCLMAARLMPAHPIVAGHATTIRHPNGKIWKPQVLYFCLLRERDEEPLSCGCNQITFTGLQPHTAATMHTHGIYTDTTMICTHNPQVRCIGDSPFVWFETTHRMDKTPQRYCYITSTSTLWSMGHLQSMVVLI